MSLASAKRRGVDTERHAHRRRFDADGGQSFGKYQIGNGLANVHFGDAGDGNNFARFGFINRNAVKTLMDKDFGNLCSFASSPWTSMRVTSCALRILPEKIRPIAMRPL